MVAQSEISGGWSELKGKAKQHWGQLNDDELREFEGTVEEFTGLLQRKTGEARSEIENWLKEADEQFRPYLENVAAQAREYAEQAGAAASEAVGRVKDQVAARQAEAEDLVKRRPVESVAVAFGVGIITGVVVGLLTSSRR